MSCTHNKVDTEWFSGQRMSLHDWSSNPSVAVSGFNRRPKLLSEMIDKR